MTANEVLIPFYRQLEKIREQVQFSIDSVDQSEQTLNAVSYESMMIDLLKKPNTSGEPSLSERANSEILRLRNVLADRVNFLKGESSLNTTEVCSHGKRSSDTHPYFFPDRRVFPSWFRTLDMTAI